MSSSFSLRSQNDSSHEFCNRGFANLHLSFKISNGSKEVKERTIVKFKDDIVKCLEMMSELTLSGIIWTDSEFDWTHLMCALKLLQIKNVFNINIKTG